MYKISCIHTGLIHLCSKYIFAHLQEQDCSIKNVACCPFQLDRKAARLSLQLSIYMQPWVEIIQEQWQIMLTAFIVQGDSQD